MNKMIFIIVIIAFVIIGGAILASLSSQKSKTTVLGATSSFSDLTPTQFNQDLTSGKYTLIDVRTKDEYKAGHIKNAKQADYYETQKFSDYLDTLDKKANYLIYCRSGHRSRQALKIMQKKGFSSVNDIAGGYNAWVSSGFPIER